MSQDRKASPSTGKKASKSASALAQALAEAGITRNGARIGSAKGHEQAPRRPPTASPPPQSADPPVQPKGAAPDFAFPEPDMTTIAPLPPIRVRQGADPAQAPSPVAHAAATPATGASRAKDSGAGRIMAVLGPTNTGKTHLAIERMCAHSSGMIGFPLRLLAREVYDRVVAIKGESAVALITGEERIEPPQARYFLCTVEAMPINGGPINGGPTNGRPINAHPPSAGPKSPFAARRPEALRDLAFVALDEAQLGADRERGHIFTDRLLHARGREETMILGSSTLEPIVRALVPEAEIVTRPRFSTLSHAGAKKLSRMPPRSAIVAFSVEQVYAIAEMLRRFRGGAAVVMGALSPQTRNAQVALYQSGEVDYLVATDAIGMGLNLDVHHVAFAGLSKFDGQRHRRLTPAEMAQIAGRAGRHQTDGTFGTLAGSGGHDSEFDDEEVYAIEEHRFAPLTRLFWRQPAPRFDTLASLIADLETPPARDELVLGPEAIDLAVLKRLSDDPHVAGSLRGAAQLRRFWDVCRLPDFRQQGVEGHARFVARLWQDLRAGQLGADYVSGQIAQLDRTAGDIDTLQARIAAIRTFAYIAQRPDWVIAREEMADRARAVEARLSDALHGRLTERFINRRTAILMKNLGPDSGLLSISLQDGNVLVEGEHIGSLRGFTFHVDPEARLTDRKLLLAAGEKHLPGVLQARAATLAASIAAECDPEQKNAPASGVALVDGALVWEGDAIARLAPGRSLLAPALTPDRALDAVPEAERKALIEALDAWLTRALLPLAPLAKLEEASRAEESGPELRALLITLVERCGMTQREDSGVDALDKEHRSMLAKLGVRVGALDLFVPLLLRPGAIALWRQLALVAGKRPGPEPEAEMPPALPAKREGRTPGYRFLGKQLVRLDMAEKLLREAYEARSIQRAKAQEAAKAHEAAKDAAPAQSADQPQDAEAIAESSDETRGDHAAATPSGSPADATAAAPRSPGESADEATPGDASDQGPGVNEQTPNAPAQSVQADGHKRTAHRPTGRRENRDAGFVLDPARAISMGLTEESYERLLRTAGFQALPARPLAEGAFGPAMPVRWRWRGPRRHDNGSARRGDARSGQNADRRRGPRPAQGDGAKRHDGDKRPHRDNERRTKGGSSKGSGQNRGGPGRSGRPERPGEPARAPGAFAALADLLGQS